MGEDLHVNAATARKLLREILASGTLTLSGHAKKELAKDRLYNPGKYNKTARKSAQFALYEALLNLLKLIAPVMPYITEEIYQLYFAEKEKEKSIHISHWPEYSESYIDKNAEETGDLVVGILQTVRKEPPY